MVDKRRSAEEAVACLESGMTVGVGGWAARRKPMALIRAILRSDLRDLTLVSYGGPEVGMLCAAGKVRRLVFAFVSLDAVPLEPHFRKARQAGVVECTELDEGMFLLGLQAAAWRVPFLPTRVGLGSDLFRVNPSLATVRSPYPGPGGGEGEVLVACPALELDAALVHLNVADERGNAAFLGPDPYFDDLLLEACAPGCRFVSVERVVATEALRGEACVHQLRVNRMVVDGVVVAPNGAHPTSCAPEYGADEEFLAGYAGSAKSSEAWESFRAAWLSFPDEGAYQREVAAR